MGGANRDLFENCDTYNTGLGHYHSSCDGIERNLRHSFKKGAITSRWKQQDRHTAASIHGSVTVVCTLCCCKCGESVR